MSRHLYSLYKEMCLYVKNCSLERHISWMEMRAFVCYKGNNEANKHTQIFLIRSNLVGYEKEAPRGIGY